MGNKGGFAASQAAGSGGRQLAAASPAGPVATAEATTTETKTTPATTSAAAGAASSLATAALVACSSQPKPREAGPLDAADSYESARENPTKITHGFWLQQYSWLHHDNALGCASAPATSDSPVPGERGGCKKRESSSQPSPRKLKGGSKPASVPARTHRLLTRWTNLMRNFGGSAADQLASQAAADESRLGCSSAPAAEQAAVGSAAGPVIRAEGWQGQQHQKSRRQRDRKKHKEAAISPNRVGDQLEAGAASGNGESKESKKRCNRFLKSLSSSSSTLLAPRGPHQQQQHSQSSQQQQRESNKQSGPAEQSGQLELPGEGGSSRTSRESPSPASPKHSSPYRQIALAIARRSPMRVFQAQRTASRAGSGSGASGDSRQQQPPTGEEAPAKRSRLTQLALDSQPSSGAASGEFGARRQQQQAPGGLLSILGSPLFGRRSETTGRQELPVDRREQQQQSATGHDKMSKTRLGPFATQVDDDNQVKGVYGDELQQVGARRASVSGDSQQKRAGSASMAWLAPTEPEARAEWPVTTTIWAAELELAGALEGDEQSRPEESQSTQAARAQSSFEFKFQLERREYYANKLAPKATSTLAGDELEAEVVGVGANSEQLELGRLERNESAWRAPGKRARVARPAKPSGGGVGGQEEAAAELEQQEDERRADASRVAPERQLGPTVDTVGSEQGFTSRAVGRAENKGDGDGEGGAGGRRTLESSPIGAAGTAQEPRQACDERSLLPLILPATSSSSSLACSSISLDSAGQPALAEWEETLSVIAGTTRICIAVEADEPSAGKSGTAGRRSRPERPAESPSEDRQAQSPDSPPGGNSGAAELERRSSKELSTPSTSARQKAAQAPSSGVGRSNFKKLVKRQQSVDSYRMARDQKSKLKQQQESRNKHQSNEAIKTKGAAGEQPVVHAHRKFSVAATPAMMAQVTSTMPTIRTAHEQLQAAAQQLRICIDPYAKPGSFTLPGEEGHSTSRSDERQAAKAQPDKLGQSQPSAKRGSPTPPNTLSLMSTNSGQPGAFIVGSFSGCITPTYPTHHLPSPKYVSPAMQANKKYSNASTISLLLGGDSSIGGNSSLGAPLGSFQSGSQRAESTCGLGGLSTGQQQQQTTTSTATNQSDTESSLGGSATPLRPLGGGSSPLMGAGQAGVGEQMSAAELAAMQNRASLASALSGEQTAEAALQAAAALEEAAAAAAAQRRAELAEHIYDNKCGLGEDMKFLASLPELCDITFLVGETREPVCAVKSVLAARSRVFHKILFGSRVRRFARQSNDRQEVETQQQQQQPLLQLQHQQQLTFQQDTVDEPEPDSRRGSSPKPPQTQTSPGHRKSLASKSSSPLSRTGSPGQPQPWSVTSDAGGYNPTSPAAAACAGEKVDGDPAATTPTKAAASDLATSGGAVLSGGPSSATRSGRVSVASSGARESVGQGSQQPLIIGPGQTATPAPPAKRNKKSSIRDSSHHGGSKLSRMFMSRASDPSIKHNHPANANHSDQNYLDKMSSSQMSTTMIIEEFEPDVFRQLIEYIHTGCVLLQARTLLGLLNAADYYGLEQLRKACLRFVSCCITVDTVCSLLSTAERYIQYKCTKSIVQKVLEFVDSHADEIFKLNAFGLLPEHVVRLILARDGLKADEQVKYSGVYTWCEHYCRSYELTNISDVMRNFLDLIQFHKIPTNVLLTEIYPTHIVPDNIFLSALAYQADPENFESEPSRARRMTLANPCTVYKDFDRASADDEQFGAPAASDGPAPPGALVGDPQSRSSTGKPAEVGGARKASQQQGRQQQGKLGDLFGSQSALGQSGKSPVRGRKSTGSQPESKARKMRKGSIAQVSISGVMRKLSIRKRHSNASAGAQAEARRRASGTSSVTGGGRQPALSKQQSAAGDKDPMQLGQQILDAFLAEQRQREIERAERELLEQLERKAAEEAKAQAETGELPDAAADQPGDTGDSAAADDNGAAPAEEAAASQQQQQQQEQQPGKQPIAKSSSTRKSFKDFRHISRRIFMRHPSSKVLQQTSSVSGFFGGHSQSPDNKDRDRRRNMLKIRRSETVFETTNSCLSPKLSSGGRIY